jgi:hypothetical protein
VKPSAMDMSPQTLILDLNNVNNNNIVARRHTSYLLDHPGPKAIYRHQNNIKDELVITSIKT